MVPTELAGLQPIDCAGPRRVKLTPRLRAPSSAARTDSGASASPSSAPLASAVASRWKPSCSPSLGASVEPDPAPRAARSGPGCRGSAAVSWLVTAFAYTYFREPLDSAAPFYRRKRHGPWEASDADGKWRVVMNGIPEVVTRLVEVPGPSFRYYVLREGSFTTYMRWAKGFNPEGPPQPLFTFWADGEWKPGPFPSENELSLYHRIPIAGSPAAPAQPRAEGRVGFAAADCAGRPRGSHRDGRLPGLLLPAHLPTRRAPIPDAALIEAEIDLEDELAREDAEGKARRIGDAEAVIEEIKRGPPEDPAEFLRELDRLAKQLPGRGAIPDVVWFLAVRAVAENWYGRLPRKMAGECAMLALGYHPCSGHPLPPEVNESIFDDPADESRTLRSA